ncbi:MAG: four helix bundle protein [Cyanobacteria bacterium J06559_3]
MYKVEAFEDLRVWQQGIALVKQIYALTNTGSLQKDFGLRDQLQRASVSIPTNIAEGFERSSTKEYIRFLVIAKGSSGEVRSLLRVAFESLFSSTVPLFPFPLPRPLKRYYLLHRYQSRVLRADNVDLLQLVVETSANQRVFETLALPHPLNPIRCLSAQVC